jgi:16S rRNA (guanine527-N7)-methyltransferase
VSDPAAAIGAILRAEFGVSGPLAERLGEYGARLLEANRRVNLTAAREPAALAAHLADSLTLVPDVDGELIDIGSGGGLPGIPLALATGVGVTLVESVAKKAAFLKQALTELGLAGETVAARAERLARDPLHRERYRVATARAVSTASTVAELTLPFLAIGGRALLQRGALDAAERQALEDAAPMLGGRFVAERPAGGDRRILIVEKVSPTPTRFPRREGIPEKRPLCLSPQARSHRLPE